MREALTDALLFNAARRQHVQEIIRPALESGAVVICDRYADSSMAYQGYGGGVPLDDVQTINFLATAGLTPDRTVLFDLPVEAGLQRRAVGAASDFTRFESTEQHDVAFHQRVRDGYLEMAAADPARWRVIDAGQPADRSCRRPLAGRARPLRGLGGSHLGGVDDRPGAVGLGGFESGLRRRSSARCYWRRRPEIRRWRLRHSASSHRRV